MAADRQHLWRPEARRALDVCESVQEFAGEPLGEHHQVRTDAGLLGQAPVGAREQYR
ncbi:hypothetical protein ACFVXC_41295 [Streptomyces sp. NPDC058257]|uniref:hypothetical protein n=1 Tax=Streptomyces sp. NPDC058257 TaxID=3346409 RepID=UPI0036E4AF6D